MTVSGSKNEPDPDKRMNLIGNTASKRDYNFTIDFTANTKIFTDRANLEIRSGHGADLI